MNRLVAVGSEQDIFPQYRGLRYPKIQVAPRLYRVEDNRLYLLKED